MLYSTDEKKVKKNKDNKRVNFLINLNFYK